MISETYGLVGELFLAGDAAPDHDDFLDEGVELGGHVDVFVLQRDAAALHLYLLHQPDTSTVKSPGVHHNVIAMAFTNYRAHQHNVQMYT